MSDAKDSLPASDIPFAYGLTLQDLFEMMSCCEALAESLDAEAQRIAPPLRERLYDATKKCLNRFLEDSYPDAHSAVLMPNYKNDAAKDSLDEIIKKGSK